MPSKEAACPVDQDPHIRTQRAMNDLRNTSQPVSHIRQRLRNEWREFYQPSRKSKIEIDYLVSRSDFDATHGTLMHVMWTDLVTNDFLPLLRRGGSIIPQSIPLDDEYYITSKTKRRYEKDSSYDLFMRTMKYFGDRASGRLFEQIALNDKHPYKQLWDIYPSILKQRIEAQKKWDGVRNMNKTHTPELSDVITVESTWEGGLSNNIHSIMESLLYRKLASKDSQRDPDTMTQLAPADVRPLQLSAHITGINVLTAITPWSLAVQGIFGEKMIAEYDPIADFNGRLVEVEDGSSLPTCHWSHNMLKEGRSKKEGFCSGRLPVATPSSLERESVKEIFARVDEEVALRPPRLWTPKGEFDSTTIAFVVGSYVARETFYQGNFPVR